MRRLTGILLAGALVTAALVVPPQAPAQVFELRDLSGAELFQRFCATCHGLEGRGDGPVARGLNTVVPDLTRIAARNDGEFPGGAVQQVIDGRSDVLAHGTRTMPVWGYEFWIEEGADRIAEREARDIIRRLVEYLADIQSSD